MAENGKDAMQILESHYQEIALLMLDLVMPVMDGFAVLRELQKRPWGKELGIIIISSETAVKVESECFDLGAADFVRRPFDNQLVKNRVSNVISLYQTQMELEQKVQRQMETLQKQYRLLQLQAEKLRRSRSNVIVSASALHDIGKIAIPDAILLKPGKLTREEFEHMKTHTTKGGEILNNIKNVWDEEYGKVSYEICRYHHERYDGNGYPDGLKGEQIPVSAQIVAVADVYDALVNERVYKSAYPKEIAFQMIMTGECGVFSPKILDSFWSVRREFEKYRNHKYGNRDFQTEPEEYRNTGDTCGTHSSGNRGILFL